MLLLVFSNLSNAQTTESVHDVGAPKSNAPMQSVSPNQKVIPAQKSRTHSTRKDTSSVETSLAPPVFGDTYSLAPLLEDSEFYYHMVEGEQATTHVYDETFKNLGSNIYGSPGGEFLVIEQTLYLGDGTFQVSVQVAAVNDQGFSEPWVDESFIGSGFTHWRLDVGVAAGGNNPILPDPDYTIVGSGVSLYDSTGTIISDHSIFDDSNSDGLAGTALIHLTDGTNGNDIAGWDLATMVMFWNIKVEYDDPTLIDPAELSGSWFNPQRDGEGFHIEIQDNNQALVIWFTYPGATDDAEAKQAWILGTGTISDNTITILNAFKGRGPEFGENYDKNDFKTDTWGNVTFTFTDEDNGQIEFDGNDGFGSIPITRVTSIVDAADAGGLPNGISGAWYNPDTDGQGWFVEVLSSSAALVYWFTYDSNGNQAWNLGVGDIIGHSILVRESQSGFGTRFGDGFDAQEVEREPFASMALGFTNCGSGQVSYYTADGAISETFPIVRLTALVGQDCPDVLPNPWEGKLTLTSNPTDPMLSRFKTMGGMVIEHYGTRDSSGNLLSETGTEITLPNGETISLRFAEDKDRVVMVHKQTGFRINYDLTEFGELIFTVMDPASGKSSYFSIPSDAIPASTSMDDSGQNGKNWVSDLERSQDLYWTESASNTFAQVTVNLCNRPTGSAEVVFDVVPKDLNQSDDGITTPATHVGNGLYQASLLENQRAEIKDLVLKNVCEDRPKTDKFCKVRNYTAEPVFKFCKRVGTGPVKIICEIINRTTGGYCTVSEEMKIRCDDEPEIVFRTKQDNVLTIAGEISKSGVEDSIFLEGNYPDYGKTTDFGTRNLSAAMPTVAGFLPTPTAPIAGESYRLELNLECAQQGEQFTLKRTNPNGSPYSKSFRVNNTGLISVNLETSSEWTEDTIILETAQGVKILDRAVILEQFEEPPTSLEKPTLLKPVGELINLPNKCDSTNVTWEFEWAAVDGAVSYGIDVSNFGFYTGNNAFSEGDVKPATSGVDTVKWSVTLPGQIPDDQVDNWVWRVWAIDSEGNRNQPPDPEQLFRVSSCGTDPSTGGSLSGEGPWRFEGEILITGTQIDHWKDTGERCEWQVTANVPLTIRVWENPTPEIENDYEGEWFTNTFVTPNYSLLSGGETCFDPFPRQFPLNSTFEMTGTKFDSFYQSAGTDPGTGGSSETTINGHGEFSLDGLEFYQNSEFKYFGGIVPLDSHTQLSSEPTPIPEVKN